jgi:hypothetical protein
MPIHKEEQIDCIWQQKRYIKKSNIEKSVRIRRLQPFLFCLSSELEKNIILGLYLLNVKIFG